MPANSYTSSSNGKRFIYLKLLVFIILLAFILIRIGDYYEELSSKNQNITDYERTWEEFYETPKGSLDLVFIGSSHAYCTFDPELVDEALGTSSFNFGSPLQYPDSSYHVFKEVLKYHKPDTMVFEIYWDMIDKDFDLKQGDIVMNAVGRSEFQEEYISDVFDLSQWIKYKFRPVRYQQDVFNYWNKELEEEVGKRLGIVEEEKKASSGVSYHRGKGFIYSDIVIPREKYYETNQFRGFDGEDWDFHPKQKAYIEDMILLAREEGVEPVFVTAPIANVSMTYIENYDLVHRKVSDLADSLGVPYRDYNIINMEEKLLENRNFRDDAHLNYSGVEIVMEDFIQWLGEIRGDGNGDID